MLTTNNSAMNKTDFWGLLILFSIIAFSFLLHGDIQKQQKAQEEIIAVFTVEDLYYLQGNEIRSERNGLMYSCSTRQEAVRRYEEITKQMAIRTIEALDSLSKIIPK